MKEQPLEIIYVDAVAELPPELFAAIGKVIVWYSYLEAHLSQIIQILLDISEAESRIATRDPRATARLEIIRDLLDYKEISVSVDFKNLWNRLDKIQKDRNLLAHNCWVRHPETNELLLGHIKGKRTDHPKIDRRIVPEGLPFGLKQCNDLSEEIDNFNEVIWSLKKQIFDSRPSLRKKYEQLFPSQFQSQDYIPLAHTPPPQSSEG